MEYNKTKIRKVGGSHIVTIPEKISRYHMKEFGDTAYVSVDEKIKISKKEKIGYLSRKVRNIKNSQIVTIPSQFAECFGFTDGVVVSAKFEDDVIIFEKV